MHIYDTAIELEKYDLLYRDEFSRDPKRSIGLTFVSEVHPHTVRIVYGSGFTNEGGFLSSLAYMVAYNSDGHRGSFLYFSIHLKSFCLICVGSAQEVGGANHSVPPAIRALPPSQWRIKGALGHAPFGKKNSP